MKIHVLGGHGGLSKGFATTSFLIDEKLLVDAGGVVMGTSIESQAKIDHILITHCHLDHIKDLAFICDNCFGMREVPFKVYTHPTVKNLIEKHLLNDTIWPDFTKLPTAERPTMSIFGVREEQTFSVGAYTVTSVKVNHDHDAMGYFIQDADSTVLFTGDTGPSERVWELAKKFTDLKAIFTEVSFPNSLQRVAELSSHHTSQSLTNELSKMPSNVPVVLTHLKPNFREVILKELRPLGIRVRVLEHDGEIFNF